ncbi:MAG: MFS transporter [Candidatus Dormibacteria bacterium]|jgi:MFS family permease
MRRGSAVRFLAGVGVSAFGDWLTTFALAVVLYRETGSYAATAAYFLVRVAPRPLGAWLGGPFGDLISPRRGILAAALTQGLITAALAIPLGLDRALWAIYVLAGMSQLVGGSWQPLTAAVMARLGTGENRHTLNLVYTGLSGGAMLVSPAIGALLLPSLGAVPLVLTDAATFAVAALLFVSLPAMPAHVKRRPSLRSAAFDGFIAVFRQRMLRIIALGAFSSTVAITALQAALPALASLRFGNSADAGLLYACVGLGSIAGSLIVLWPPLRRPGVILPGIACEIAGIGAVAVAGAPAVDLLILMASTATASLAQVEGGVVVQSQAPDTVGRIQGAVSTSRYLGMSGGAALALVLAVTVESRWQVLVMILAIGGLIVLGLSALGPRATPTASTTAQVVSALSEIPD